MIHTGVKELVSISAVVTTILQFLSGMLVCRQYVVKGTTGESSPLPFICGFLSCGIWLIYGLIKDDNVIIFVNITGLILMVSYIFVFYNYTHKKSNLTKQFIASILLYLALIAYMSVEIDNEKLLRRVGKFACTFTLVTIASPLSKLYYVMKTRCTECLPFPMILMSFIVSSLWYLYGLLEEDYILMLSNAWGSAISGLQLCLFMIFPATSCSPLTAKTTLA